MAELREKAPSPEKVCPLLVGAAIPELTLKTADVSPFELSAAVKTEPAVLVFYRGGW